MSWRSASRALTGSAVLGTGVLLVAACGPASVPGAAVPSGVPASGVLRGPAPAPQFTGLAFPDAADGWLLGEPAADVAGTGSASAEIWHTATGGATWQEQWHGAGSPRSIAATDADHAWALVTCPPGGGHASCQPELLATADGGQHWQAAAVMPREVDQVQFVTDSFGIATVDGCLGDVNASRCQGQVLVSHDGGATWMVVLATDAPVFATADAAGQLWAAETAPGSSRQPGLLGSGVRFLTSTDRGRSWLQLGTAASVPVTAAIRIRLAAGPSGLAWASLFDGGSCAMHGCGVAGLLHSTDGGRTWSGAPLTSGAFGCGWGSLTYSAAPDGTVLAASGVPGGACAPPFGFLFRYGPSGWQRLPSWPLTGAIALSVVSQDVAYAITQDAVVRTGDGGRHWTQLLPAPAPAGQVAAVSATTALGGQDTVGAAEAGAVLRTEDGGRSWQQVADLPGIITWLDFPSAADGVAATYQAGPEPVWELWRTRDLGSQWSLAGRLPAAGGGNGGVFGPWMSADGHGLLLAVAGTEPWQEQGSGASGPARIWTTTDWGTTWTQGGPLPLDGDTLQGPASFGYAPGSPGGLAPGLAGGQAGWTGWLAVATSGFQIETVATRGTALVPLSVPAGNGIQLTDPRTGFAWAISGPGAGGTVTLYRTTDGGRTWQRARVRLELSASSAAAIELAFTDATHGWLVAAAAAWHTADGGRTWTPA
jgi:photosystem II stability/assembly factor-like uncharacterized protein